jgi:hypothetical protein
VVGNNDQHIRWRLSDKELFFVFEYSAPGVKNLALNFPSAKSLLNITRIPSGLESRQSSGLRTRIFSRPFFLP